MKDKAKAAVSGLKSWFRLSDGFSFGKAQLATLVLFLVVAGASLFGLPASAVSSIDFTVPGWAGLLALVPFIVSLLGTRRGLIVGGVGTAVIAPLLQPPLALLLMVAALGYGIYLAFRADLSRIPFKGVRGVARGLLVVLPLVGYVLFYLASAKLGVPAFHAVACIAWKFLPTTVVLGLAATCTLWLVRRSRKAKEAGTALPSGYLRLTLRYGWVVALWAFGFFSILANTSETLISVQMRHSIQPGEMSELPFTVQNRMVPRTTAEYWIAGHNDAYRGDSETPHIQKIGDDLTWQSPVHDRRWYGRLLGSVDRVLRVNSGDTRDHAEHMPDSGFVFGNDSWVLESTFKARHPFSELGEVSYFHNPDGSWSILASVVSTRPTWTGTMVPYVSGVLEVRQNGVVLDHSLNGAKAQFPGAVFYPVELMRKYADAYARWRPESHLGPLSWLATLWQTKVMQEDVLEVAEDPKDHGWNMQPYIQDIEGLGLQGVVTFEPLGNKAFALVEVLFFDAATGMPRSYVVPKGSGLNSPRYCVDNVRQSNPQIDWHHIKKVEPLLVNVRGGGTYFLITIVTDYPDNPNRKNVHAYVTTVLVTVRGGIESIDLPNATAVRQFLEKLRLAPKQP